MLVQKVRQAVARGSADPLPAALLEAKFLDCASLALPADAAGALLTMLRELENVGTIGSVTRAMVP